MIGETIGEIQLVIYTEGFYIVNGESLQSLTAQRVLTVTIFFYFFVRTAH